jgi:PAT family beta-lactamase induction signal transducer AmpG
MQAFTKPGYIFFLVFPAGISQGFATITLPYLLIQNGFSVAAAAAVVAVGFSANIWRFLWGPIVDISLSLRKWFWIGLTVSTASILVLCITPLTVKGAVLLGIIVFISQVAGTFTLLPANAFMAKSIEEKHKGKASGWYQAGSLGGVGFGGGVGLWTATHFGVLTAGIVLCLSSLLFALVVFLIKDIQHAKGETILSELKTMGKDIVAMIKVPIALFAIILITLPIGTGALANLWSAIAQDWKTGADTVALVTGVISGVVSAVGCIAGGFFIDRKGIWFAYFGSGMICSLVALVMAAMPYSPAVYIGGVLAYTFGIGLINAGFTALILFAIGKKNVATKYSLLASLGNLPVVYMTALDGWAHDKYNSRYMLLYEAVLGIFFVLICMMILSRMRTKKLELQTID